MNEIIRPPGFPLTEDDVRDLLQMRMGEIVYGAYRTLFSEWILRGQLGEPYKPVSAVDIFPTPALNDKKWTYQAHIVTYNQEPLPTTEYWKLIRELPFPQRIIRLEQEQYGLIAQNGDQVLESVSLELLGSLVPAALVVMNKPYEDSKVPSVYLFSPTILPPYASYRLAVNVANSYRNE